MQSIRQSLNNLWVTALALSFAAAPTHAASLQAAMPMSAALEEAIPPLNSLPSPTLPRTPLLDRLLVDAPTVRAAQGMQQAAVQNGQILLDGTHEFVGQAQMDQRRVVPPDAPVATKYNELQLLIQRQLRLPSQARADAHMANALSVTAHAELDSARQNLLSSLLVAWFNAQFAQANVALAKQNLLLLQQQVHALHRRESLGDASILELEQMQAEEGRAKSALLLAQGMADSQRAALAARYPALAADTTLSGQPDSTATLAMPTLRAKELLALVEQHSAALEYSRARLQEARALVAQDAAMRTPQPTVGAYLASDRGGQERVIGLQFSMPFGGPARVARERAALAELDAAQWRLHDIQAQTLANFERLFITAQSQASGALAQEQATQVQIQASTRMLRAYQLGEVPISDWLMARRSALTAEQQLLLTDFDAARSAALLKLNAGLLFDLSQSAAVMPAVSPAQEQPQH
ncbi:MAG: TolC family protein [Burkholderiales bacterium]